MTTASALFPPVRLEDSRGLALEDAQVRALLTNFCSHSIHPLSKYVSFLQKIKLEWIAKTLLTVQPYDRVLDLEFGWGFSGAYMIEKIRGVDLVGVTVTEEQGIDRIFYY